MKKPKTVTKPKDAKSEEVASQARNELIAGLRTQVKQANDQYEALASAFYRPICKKLRIEINVRFDEACRQVISALDSREAKIGHLESLRLRTAGDAADVGSMVLDLLRRIQVVWAEDCDD